MNSQKCLNEEVVKIKSKTITQYLDLLFQDLYKIYEKILKDALNFYLDNMKIPPYRTYALYYDNRDEIKNLNFYDRVIVEEQAYFLLNIETELTKRYIFLNEIDYVALFLRKKHIKTEKENILIPLRDKNELYKNILKENEYFKRYKLYLRINVPNTYINKYIIITKIKKHYYLYKQ